MVKITSEIAEICGIHAGDGYLRNDGKRVELEISGNMEEKEYYDSHVIPLFNKIFNINLIGRFFPSKNTYGFVIRDKKVIKFIHDLGFPYGAKSLTVKIPLLILKSKNKNIYSGFLRGLFDTDGSLHFHNRPSGKYVSFKKTYHYYPRISLTTVSFSLHKDTIKILKFLDFNSFNVTKYKPKTPMENLKYVITVYGNTNLEKWMDIVRPKNNVKISRYLIWKKFGFCPPRLCQTNRIEILKNKKDPFLFYLGS
jgi:hypothetical protein